ncbi:MAG TPA: ATP-binding protein [Pyrinomonadaceae bacterium]|nr:ATP-binding protein [Pyrinomonadaceae bacterium]
MKPSSNDESRQILGRVKRDEFVGRSAELDRLVSQAARGRETRGTLILLAPLAGVSELLRQTYDELFRQRGDVVPIYFALPPSETTAVSAAIEFLNTFLTQYVAFRRNEPSLCQTSLTLNDLVQLAPAADLDWIQELVDGYHDQRFSNDDRELIRFCLSAPRRVPASGGRAFVIFEALQLSGYANSGSSIANEIVRAVTVSNVPFVLAGLRREILHVVERAGGNSSSLDVIRLEQLDEQNARALVTSAARRQGVSINDETRDLIIQQLESSPFFITAILQAAREKQVSLGSYLDCERLYVDEILGGRLNRYFTALLEQIAPVAETRAALVKLLCEALPPGNRTASFESWRKRLKLESAEVEIILDALHVHELINWDGESINTGEGSTAWKDYLRSRFRLDALREPRALVVADMMADALKRAPHTIAQHYRRIAGLRLRELAGKFNAQRVPKALFDYEQFAEVYKGLTPDAVAMGLDAETDLVRLPQVFHTATGASFTSELKRFGEEASVVAHGFEGATYTDRNEIVWLVAKIDSKLEADKELTESWLNRLDSVALKAGARRSQIWLIANEGFSHASLELLRSQNAFSSNREQFEILTARLSGAQASLSPSDEDEIVLVLPMGSDYELLAATTVEQFARKLNFRPDAINQIKTAIVEACINASEHSLSPERKIYQRFRVEDDKLVITISSRGIVPSNLNGLTGEGAAAGETGSAGEQRRGWGLRLIKTLMDEVEFERVDEGTSLRMTKFLRR